MQAEEQLEEQRGDPPAPPAIVWVMCLIFVGFEGAFQLSEAFGNGGLRWIVSKQMAFFDLYFEAATAGRAAPMEFYWSFFTHSLLHGNLFHLIFNGVIFLSLGGAIVHRIGGLRFLILFFVCAAVGATTWGLIFVFENPVTHLVGASGGIFGFFGALKRWEWRWIGLTGASPRRFWGTISALILMNVLLFFFYSGGGGVAWEAHLGGFVAGWLIAPILAPRLVGPSPI